MSLVTFVVLKVSKNYQAQHRQQTHRCQRSPFPPTSPIFLCLNRISPLLVIGFPSLGGSGFPTPGAARTKDLENFAPVDPFARPTFPGSPPQQKEVQSEMRIAPPWMRHPSIKFNKLQKIQYRNRLPVPQLLHDSDAYCPASFDFLWSGGILCCNQPSPTSVGSLPVVAAVPVRPSAHAIAPSWEESWHRTRLEAPAAARALL